MHGIEVWIIGPGAIGVLHFQQSGIVLAHKLLQSALVLWAYSGPAVRKGARCPVACNTTGQVSVAWNDLSDPISTPPCMEICVDGSLAKRTFSAVLLQASQMKWCVWLDTLQQLHPPYATMINFKS